VRSPPTCRSSPARWGLSETETAVLLFAITCPARTCRNCWTQFLPRPTRTRSPDRRCPGRADRQGRGCPRPEEPPGHEWPGPNFVTTAISTIASRPTSAWRTCFSRPASMPPCSSIAPATRSGADPGDRRLRASGQRDRDGAQTAGCGAGRAARQGSTCCCTDQLERASPSWRRLLGRELGVPACWWPGREDSAGESPYSARAPDIAAAGKQAALQ